MKQKTVTEEIQELRAMKVPDLVDRYRAAFGREPRSRNRQHLL